MSRHFIYFVALARRAIPADRFRCQNGAPGESGVDFFGATKRETGCAILLLDVFQDMRQHRHPDPRNSHAPFHSQALGFPLAAILRWLISISAVLCTTTSPLLPQTRQDREAFVVRLHSLYICRKQNKNGYDGSVGVLPFASKAFFGGNSYRT